MNLSVVKDSKVDPGVEGTQLFPFQVLVKLFGTKGRVKHVSELYIGPLTAWSIDSKVSVVVPDLLVSGYPVASAKLQFRDEVAVLHKAFVHDLPTNGNRREAAPSVVFRES